MCSYWPKDSNIKCFNNNGTYNHFLIFRLLNLGCWLPAQPTSLLPSSIALTSRITCLYQSQLLNFKVEGVLKLYLNVFLNHCMLKHCQTFYRLPENQFYINNLRNFSLSLKIIFKPHLHKLSRGRVILKQWHTYSWVTINTNIILVFQ